MIPAEQAETLGRLRIRLEAYAEDYREAHPDMAKALHATVRLLSGDAKPYYQPVDELKTIDVTVEDKSHA
jgi:hypothetical protein